MKYDKDLIETIYLLQQNDPQLAERMWNRLVGNVQLEKQKQEDFTTKKINLGFGLDISQEVLNYMQRNHSAYNKVLAIKGMQEKTGWGLKAAKDAVDYMISQGWL